MFTVIYKPTLECNQSCGYCYVGLRNAGIKPTVQNKGIDTFSLLLENLARNEDKNICMIFHGGEPSLMGEGFFKRCASLIGEYGSRYGLSVKKCVQTNLLNVSMEKLARLKEMGYEISTSLDGTEFAHNHFRIDKTGAGTFGRVVESIRLATKKGFVVNAICCVSQINMGQAKEVYELFEELNVNPKFNYLEDETGNLPADARISPEQYADFVLEVTRIWLNNKDSRIDVMPSSDMLSAIVTGCSESCFHSTDCQRHFVCVGPNGDVWPCGKCIGISRFHLGNISDPDNGVVSYNRRKNSFGKGVGMPGECAECEYSNLCNGLCPFDTYAEHQSFDKTNRWCRAYKIMWEGMKNFVASHNLDRITERGKSLI